ncbi:RdgB/HAM1 family non-canonical purine NTP pyrophosphatase [Myxosarcina sp. GI1(2024)]
MRKLIVATSNPGKLREMEEYLTGLDWQLELKPKTIEIAETGATFSENARLKACGVAKAMNHWAIADDSGLAVDALNDAPGIYSARYGSSDAERIARLLRELGDNPHRKAKFICAIAIARPDGSVALETEGICQGEIITAPRGDNGFGYDPIFFVPQQQKTFAEMTPETKARVSHRGIAFGQLLPKLKEL